ncbi:sodium/phosphate symporter [Haloglomus halophilum]|uniref:sodium/phosphate symporter n=1 Tax=Haloglomus halophilum TaxID=2962672 RepID=UPI0020C96F20|nr:sodium/phosphate symporter [Haloglomus halophilum]
MTDRRRGLALVALATLAVGIATRAWPLYWSPYPATLDAFRYARLAEATTGGALPIATLQADELVFTIVHGFLAAVTGVSTLRIAQPMVAVTGGASCLTAVALVVRIGRERDWSTRRLRIAATTAGLGIAVEGLYLRRSGVPDEEAFGLLVVPLLALAAWQALRTRRPAWWIPTVALTLTMPLLHNMSGLVAGMTLTGVATAALVRSRDRWDVLAALAIGLGYWTVYFGYALTAPAVGLDLTYSGLLSGTLGLFVAWVVAVGILAVWSRSASPTALRLAWLLPVGGWFVLVGVNTVVTIYPGTVPSPNLVALLIGAYVVPVVLVGVGLPAGRAGSGTPALAALLAPVALTYYALTATLTPQFFDLLIRVQSFAHLPAFVFVGVALGAVLVRAEPAVRGVSDSIPGVAADGGVTGASGSERIPSWLGAAGRVALTLIFVIALAATLPVGYVDLDTGAMPSTTTPGEFQGVTFAERYVNGSYATDHALSRVGIHYYTETGATVQVIPIRSWLQGGPPPTCPVLVAEDWVTAGAHLYPTAPETLSRDRYEGFLERRHVVYHSGGVDSHTLVVPRASSKDC